MTALNFSSRSNLEKDYIIFSNDFSHIKNEDIDIFNFYDISNKYSLTLTIKDNKLFIIMKLSLFGSVFIGNYVCEEPTTLIVKQINPIMLIIGIMFSTTKIEDNKFSFSDINSSIFKYKENLENIQKLHNLEESDIESTNNILDFLKDYFNSEEKAKELEKICEKNFNSFTNLNYFKLSISKVLNYLNAKIKNIEQENLRNVLSIIIMFIPNEIADSLLNFKSMIILNFYKNKLLDVNLDEKTDTDVSDINNLSLNKELNNISEYQNHGNLKRKAEESSEINETHQKSNKKKTETQKNKKVNDDKYQHSISTFFKKK